MYNSIYTWVAGSWARGVSSSTLQYQYQSIYLVASCLILVLVIGDDGPSDAAVCCGPHSRMELATTPYRSTAANRTRLETKNHTALCYCCCVLVRRTSRAKQRHDTYNMIRVLEHDAPERCCLEQKQNTRGRRCIPAVNEVPGTALRTLVPVLLLAVVVERRVCCLLL